MFGSGFVCIQMYWFLVLFIINDFQMPYSPHINKCVGRTLGCRHERYGPARSFTVSEYRIQVLKFYKINYYKTFVFMLGFHTHHFIDLCCN